MAMTENCTLREAVQASNTNAAVDACEAGQANKLDTIELSAGEYNLTIDGDGEDQNETGDLDVTPDAPAVLSASGARALVSRQLTPSTTIV